MKKQLGLPIFYRIDKFIHFDDFSCETIYQIVQNEILARKEEYDSKLTPEMVYAAVLYLNENTFMRVDEVAKELLEYQVKQLTQILEQEGLL